MRTALRPRSWPGSPSRRCRTACADRRPTVCGLARMRPSPWPGPSARCTPDRTCRPATRRVPVRRRARSLRASVADAPGTVSRSAIAWLPPPVSDSDAAVAGCVDSLDKFVLIGCGHHRTFLARLARQSNRLESPAHRAALRFGNMASAAVFPAGCAADSAIRRKPAGITPVSAISPAAACRLP